MSKVLSKEEAENQLYSELGFASGIDKNSGEQHIIKQVESV